MGSISRQCLCQVGIPGQAGDDYFVMPDLIGHLTLKFVLHVADDLTVEEVDDALGAGCVFL